MVSNFLKHADRDAMDYISTDEVDNLPLLVQALASYLDLASDDIGPEGFVLWIIPRSGFWNDRRLTDEVSENRDGLKTPFT